MLHIIRKFTPEDWAAVAEIYTDGITKGKATFADTCPTFEQWDTSHLPNARFVSVDERDVVVGFSTLSATSARVPYKGVCEVSVYVAPSAQQQSIGFSLLQTLVDYAEQNGIWSLQCSLSPFNYASIAIHEKCGFRKVSIREKIAKDIFGQWQDTMWLERRSKTIL